MENAHLLKEYFLPYAFCVTCSEQYRDSKRIDGEIDSGDAKNMVDTLSKRQQCTEHGHIFTNLSVEQHMIPIIMQQFLIDLGVNASKLASKNYANEHSMNTQSATVHNAIDLKEIEQFWNDYIDAIPSDLEMIWDSIENGLVRYLHVI